MQVVRDVKKPGWLAMERAIREADGLEVMVGFQHGSAAEDDGTDVCDVAAWNELGTSTIPSRPFMRKSVDENKAKINAMLKNAATELTYGKPARMVLADVGMFQKDLVQEKITEGSFKANAPSTIRRKGSSRPLIDTGRMRESVQYVVRKRGSRR